MHRVTNLKLKEESQGEQDFLALQFRHFSNLKLKEESQGEQDFSALQFRRRHFRCGPFRCRTISLPNNFGARATGGITNFFKAFSDEIFKIT